MPATQGHTLREEHASFEGMIRWWCDKELRLDGVAIWNGTELRDSRIPAVGK